ncbi:DUF6044 family protein [Prevotella sp. 10(H)]|uniref:DUF6044 family protein n=1 Tax=Prevotella sp. 10(H) TaxID=1158294 RepID=UPI000AC00BF6|nr:DUF6044 family protein [Prevotella sp. 10(H)]
MLSSLFDKYGMYCGIAIITIIFLPYVIEGEGIHTPIFDNLDSNVVWAKMVLDEGGLFLPPGETVGQIMDGIPHASVYGTYDISLVWFQLLGSFWGYVFSKYLIALIGFLGMYFLIRKYLLTDGSSSNIALAVAVLFGLLPFWSFSASVAGIPMVVLAFLNIRKGNISWYNWLMLFVYAFYSSAVTTGFFVLLIIGCLFLTDWARKKRFNLYFFLSMVFLCGMYIISHLPLFYSFLYDSDYVSHRVEFQFYGVGLRQVAKDALSLFVDGDAYGHAISLQKYMLIPILFILLLMIKNRKVNKLYCSILLFLVLTSLFYGFYDWNKTVGLVSELGKILPLDLKRFFWLHPVCWAILLCMALYYIYNEIKWGKHIVSIILLFQFCYVISEQPYFKYRELPSYGEFYAEEQFQDIKSYIGKEPSTYRVISIWLHPAISQYNGFYTVDGFSTSYPLSYKHQFRKIIEKELVKTRDVFFDIWGSRCYAYSSECGANDFSYDNNLPEIQHLDYNYDVLKEMGGEYILSAVNINEGNNPRLRLLKVFDGYKDSHWTIYLYEVL